MDHYLLLAINWNPASDWNLVIEELKGQFSWLVATHLIHQAQSVFITIDKNKAVNYLKREIFQLVEVIKGDVDYLQSVSPPKYLALVKKSHQNVHRLNVLLCSSLYKVVVLLQKRNNV